MASLLTTFAQYPEKDTLDELQTLHYCSSVMSGHEDINIYKLG